MKGLKKSFGDCVLIDDLNFVMFKGVIVGIIGVNGVGKLMFFKMLSGEEKFDSGEIIVGEIVEFVIVD